MRKFLRCCFSLFTLTLLSEFVFSQAWKDVASIFYDNCTTCHRPGEIGDGYLNATGYSLLTNSSYFYSIPSYVNSGLMPPWKADPNYHHFLDERILSQNDKDAITNWVNAGAPAGDTSLAPQPPVFPTGSQIGTPDLVLTMAQPHQIIGNGIDDYECFVLPTNLLQDQDISALEFRAGNGAAVHHVFMYLVKDSSAVYADEQTPEYGYPSFGGAGEGVHADFLGLYAPGMVPRFYPAHGIVTFPAGSFLLIQIHYAPLTYPTTDQSSVNLFFSNYTDPRQVKATRVGEGYITNPPFKINAYEVDTFYSEYPVDGDYSLFAIAPHQHLLGKSFRIFAVTSTDDTLPLISIPQWDFHWQLLYSYPFMIHLQPGTVVHAVAVYDNTTNNPNNPNNPPVEVHYGEGSTDEMFKYLICTLNYVPGDETLVIDSTWHPVGIPPIDGIVSTPQLYDCFPNPANNIVAITYYLPYAMKCSLKVYDIFGRLLSTNTVSETSGLNRFDLDVSKFIVGHYLVSLQTNILTVTKPLVVER